MTWQCITSHLAVAARDIAVLYIYTVRLKIQPVLYTLHGDSKQLNAAETVDRNSSVTLTICTRLPFFTENGGRRERKLF